MNVYDQYDDVLGWQELVPVYWEQDNRGHGMLSAFPHLQVGDIVRCRHGFDEWEYGVVEAIWFGIEEMIAVCHVDGRRKNWAPLAGDQLQIKWGAL